MPSTASNQAAIRSNFSDAVESALTHKFNSTYTKEQKSDIVSAITTNTSTQDLWNGSFKDSELCTYLKGKHSVIVQNYERTFKPNADIQALSNKYNGTASGSGA